MAQQEEQQQQQQSSAARAPQPAEPASPTIDTYLPDDSPGPSDGWQPQRPSQPAYTQATPPAYPAAPAEPARPSYSEEAVTIGPGRAHSSDGAEALLQQTLMRPASAPHPAEASAGGTTTLARPATAGVPRRPASVGGNYGRSGPPSSAGGSSARGYGGPPAHNRLYADYFSKQSRLEEERRLRWEGRRAGGRRKG